MSLFFALLAAAAAQPADFLREEQTGLLAFSYGWPAAVERDPALSALLRRHMDAVHAEATADALESRSAARAGGFEFRPHDYGQGWEVAGNSAQLVSLAGSTSTYSGGAHGNMSYSALLWDPRARRIVDAAALFGPGLARMSGRYCAELNRQQAEKRGEPVRPDPDDPFSRCPAIGEQVLVPADSDGDARFDTLRVLLPPYAAGPYVEGDYVVEVRFDSPDLAHIPDGYRFAFTAWGERLRPPPDE